MLRGCPFLWELCRCYIVTVTQLYHGPLIKSLPTFIPAGELQNGGTRHSWSIVTAPVINDVVIAELSVSCFTINIYSAGFTGCISSSYLCFYFRLCTWRGHWNADGEILIWPLPALTALVKEARALFSSSCSFLLYSESTFLLSKH